METELIAAVFTRDLSHWWDCGLDDHEIVAWTQAGVSLQDAIKCVSVGVDDPALADWFLGMPREDQLDWDGAVPTQELRAWAAVVHDDPRHVGALEARSWRAAGYTPTEAAPWIDAGFPTPADRDWWQHHAAGVPSHRGDVDLNDPRRLGGIAYNGWRRQRLDGSPTNQGEWGCAYKARLYGGHDPEAIAQWHRRNIAQWHIHPDGAGQLHAAGVTPEWALTALEHTFRSGGLHGQVPYLLRLHADYGNHPAEDAAEAFHLEWGRIQHAVQWYGQGFTVAQTAQWAKALQGVDLPAEVARWWADRGAKPGDVARYERSGGTWLAARERRPVTWLLWSRGADPRAAQQALDD